MTAPINVRYGLATVLYTAAVYWASSLPDLAVRQSHPLLLALSNLSHAPVFAGLAYCVLKTLGGRNAAREHYAAAFVLTGLVAVFDEWHQSFVPGRTASATDLLLDAAGIAAMLVAVRLWNLSIRRECEAK
jgi:VanZ family protein